MGSGGAEITVGDLMKLIKGFVDMLILASGYQSSGLLACWDSLNIKRAFKWGLFLENMFRHLNSSHKYLDFMKKLDAAVSEMRSHPSFPQGLTYLSSATLIRARVLLAEHMIHALPLRDEHLKEFFIAATEMDLDALRGKEYDYLNVYLDRVMSLRSSLTVVIDRSISTKDPMTISHQSVENVETGNCTFSDNTTLAVQELLKRQSAVSCLLTAEIGLDILTESISLSYLTNNDYSCRSEHLNHAAAILCGEQLVDYAIWSHWRSRNLLYFLQKRTIRLVSGASMIFSAPKVQWIQVFKHLNLSSKTDDDDFLETLEIILLGCISSRWNYISQHLMLASYDMPTISKQYQQMCDLLRGRSQSLHVKFETVNPKEKEIVEYIGELLAGQVNQLCKLSPALVAAAIPTWSPLFRLYLAEIKTQFKGEYSTIRHCSCANDIKEHIDCEIISGALAERIWCLYIFHVCESNRRHGKTSST